MDRLILDSKTESAEDRVLAKIMVEKVSRELGMRQPEIKFFHPSTEDLSRGLMGYYSCGCIYLNCRLSQQQLLSTARHEARHAFQDTRIRFRTLSLVALERDARVFELL
jgi:hypothetical protein